MKKELPKPQIKNVSIQAQIEQKLKEIELSLIVGDDGRVSHADWSEYFGIKKPSFTAMLARARRRRESQR